MEKIKIQLEKELLKTQKQYNKSNATVKRLMSMPSLKLTQKDCNEIDLNVEIREKAEIKIKKLNDAIFSLKYIF